MIQTAFSCLHCSNAHSKGVQHLLLIGTANRPWRIRFAVGADLEAMAESACTIGVSRPAGSILEQLSQLGCNVGCSIQQPGGWACCLHFVFGLGCRLVQVCTRPWQDQVSAVLCPAAELLASLILVSIATARCFSCFSSHPCSLTVT